MINNQENEIEMQQELTMKEINAQADKSSRAE